MSSSLVPCNSNEPFLYRTVTCNKKWILHDNRRWPVQWLDQEEASKPFPKPNLHQKNGHGHCCLVVRCQSGSLSESRQNHYMWDICSANQWDRPKTARPAASIGQQKGPNSSPQQCLTTRHITLEVEQTGPWSFASSAIFAWPLANQLPLLQATRHLFAGETLLQPAGGSLLNPEVQIFFFFEAQIFML